MVLIANTKIGLDPNNSVIKRLWCNLFKSFRWLIMRKTEKGDNSVMDFENFKYQKLIRSSTH